MIEGLAPIEGDLLCGVLILLSSQVLESLYGRGKKMKQAMILLLGILLLSSLSYFLWFPPVLSFVLSILFAGAYLLFQFEVAGCLIWVFTIIVSFGYSMTIHDWHILNSNEIEEIVWTNLEQTKPETAYLFTDIQCLSQYSKSVRIQVKDHSTTYTVSPLASRHYTSTKPIEAWLLSGCYQRDFADSITLIRMKTKSNENKLIRQIKQEGKLKVAEQYYGFREAPSQAGLVSALWVSRIFGLIIVFFVIYHEIYPSIPEEKKET